MMPNDDAEVSQYRGALPIGWVAHHIGQDIARQEITRHHLGEKIDRDLKKSTSKCLVLICRKVLTRTDCPVIAYTNPPGRKYTAGIAMEMSKA